LAALLRGDAEATGAAECLELASLCQLPCKQLHTAATRFAADAFSADAKLAEDLAQAHRYNAACSAALAAAGQADDAKHLPDKVQLMLRRQALAWLRADLAAYWKLARAGEPNTKQFAHDQVAHWQQDTDLASVRDRDALARLPDDEHRAWNQLWGEVAALLKQVEAKK
jgi:hypothetical protein